MTVQTERRLLLVLLISFFVLASAYSIATPLFEMSDELWHYPMVKTLADGNPLPIQDPATPGPWRQEGSQPPLYYYLGAGITWWIDTSDIGEVLRPNPHVDNGIITPDGNTNLIVHNTQRETGRWSGTVLAVHLIRLLSAAMSTAAVYFTYRIGLELFSERRWLALASAAVMAFIPMFIFISGAVNNDNLATLLAAVSLWLMIRIVKEADEDRDTFRLASVLGLTLGLAALTKTSTLGLFGLAGLATAYSGWVKRRWQSFFVEGPLILLIAGSIAGWWYVRNLRLYGDPLGLSAFIAILGQRAHPASLLQLWGERHGFMQSFWGLFGGVNIPMADWVYAVLNALAVMSIIGIVVVLVKRGIREGLSLRKWMLILLTMLWIAGVVLPLALSWARITWSSQGRLVFSALSPIAIWFTVGLTIPWPRKVDQIIASGLVAGLFALSVAALPLWIVPAYQLEAMSSRDYTSADYTFSAPGESEPFITLVGYYVSPSTVKSSRCGGSHVAVANCRQNRSQLEYIRASK